MTTAKPASASLPDGWTVAALGDIAEIAFSGVDKKTVEGEIPVRLCNYTDVFYNRTIHGELPFMAATATPAERDRWALKKGDVLFTKDSETPDEIGVPAHVAEDMPEVLCGYHLGRARPDPERVTGPFLAALLRTHRIRRQFARIANGVTRFGLTLSATRTLRIALPPLREQRSIAFSLNSINNAIDATDALAAVTVGLRKALRHQMHHTGHLAGRFPSPTGRAATVWPVVCLGEIAQVNPPRPILDTDPNAEVPFIPMRSVATDGLGLISSQTRPYHKVSSGYTIFADGDILFSKITPCMENGKHALADLGGAPFGFGTTEFHVVRPGARATADYLFDFLTQPRQLDYCSRQFTGSAGQRRLPAEVLRSLRLPLPSIREQRIMSRVLRAGDTCASWLRQESSALTHLHLSLSEGLLAGQTDSTARGNPS